MGNININTVAFDGWTEELIKDTLLNRADRNTISMGLYIRDNIRAVIEELLDDEYPIWFNQSLSDIINQFVGIMSVSATLESSVITERLNDFRVTVLFGQKKDLFRTINYTLPFLENYAKTYKITKNLSDLNTVTKSANETIDELHNSFLKEVNSLEERFNKFKIDADSTLSLLNKQAGQIGVKDYAEIFENQAKEHSRLFKKGLGKAQTWIGFALVAFAGLVFLFTRLDSFFSVKGAISFTPEVVVHIIGRFLLISLFIFIVSFSFKQFRINMHLYTLNKHRANTLKSFEYLTRAPDKLEASSYNAILMEVAKAIYDAGQTGYVSLNDGHADMPSIIDLSKVITQSKTP